MSLRRPILPRPDPDGDPAVMRVADLLLRVEVERLARELHTTDHRLNRFEPAAWAAIMPAARGDCLGRAAVAIRMGDVAAVNVGLYKAAALVADKLGEPDPLKPSARAKALALEAVAGWLGHLGGGA